MNELREQARAGDTDAMCDLGDCYYSGSGGVEQDYGEALVWYGKAAAKGRGYALYRLGVMHEKGIGTSMNLLNALVYYKQARDKGFELDRLVSGNPVTRIEATIPPEILAALRFAEAAAASTPPPPPRPTFAASTEAARLEQEMARGQQEDTANKQQQVELQQLQQTLEAQRVHQQQKDTELKQLQQSLDAERARQQQKDAELQQRESTVRQREEALDALKREQEAQQRAKDQAAAAFSKAQKDAAAAKQAEILEERRTEGSPYVATRDAVVASWTPTKIKLAECPVHAQPITPGQSVLLEKCLHAICRDCAPHMIQPENSVSCPVCKVDSPLKGDALPPHPFIEAELAAGEVHDCELCKTNPIDEDGAAPATFKCTDCVPEWLYCEAHALRHRTKATAHALTPLPHGGAALRCATHDKSVEAYCTACRALICLACLASTHPAATHPAHLLTDAAFVEAVRARLVEAVAVARTVASALIDHAAEATVAVTEVDACDAEIGSEIDRTINVLAGILEHRRDAAHRERSTRTREERGALQTTRDESEYHWRIITSAADLAEQLATGTHLGVNATAVMVQLAEAATARLDAVLELAPERGVPPPSILRFSFDESVGKQLETLGEIVQDAP